MRLSPSERGSIPLALLAAIVTGGLITALLATVVQSERTVRFDRSYTNVIQGADAGVQDVFHRLARGHFDFDAADTYSGTTSISGQTAQWQVTQGGPREYEVISTGTEADGTERTVVVTLEEDALFFPGAFGDRLVALNGTSTEIDSYESATPLGTCPSVQQEDRCWGDDPTHGTGKGALGTNENFDFSGSPDILRAILYDWRENPGDNVTDENPGGTRCKGQNVCIPEVLGFEALPLEYATDDAMGFIFSKLKACDGTNADGVPRERGHWKIGGAYPSTLEPYGDDLLDDSNPTDPGWQNYYCADSLEFFDTVDLATDVRDGEPPTVIFVRDSVKVNNHARVNCVNCPVNTNHEHRLDRNAKGTVDNRPSSPSLQIFVATETPSAGADVNISAHAAFGGAVFAPRANCGASGNAGAHIYGSLICRTVDNVGNWRFHFDEVLADYGRASFSMAAWREDHTEALD